MSSFTATITLKEQAKNQNEVDLSLDQNYDAWHTPALVKELEDRLDSSKNKMDTLMKGWSANDGTMHWVQGPKESIELCYQRTYRK